MDGRPDSTDVAVQDAVANVITAGLIKCDQDAESNAASLPDPEREVMWRCEDRAEEWHFDEAIHSSRVQEHRELSRGFTRREKHAKENHQRHVQDHERRVADIFMAVEAEEQQFALELAGLREQLVETQHQIEELEEDCEIQVRACEQEILGERQKRSELEQELEKEKQSVREASQHINEIEDRESELMRSQRQRMSDNRAASQRQMLEVQRNGDLEIREINKAFREDMVKIQKMVGEKIKDTHRGVDSWVQQRRDVAAASDRDIIETVDTKVHQGLSSVHMRALDTREASLDLVKEIQKSDFEHEALLRDKIHNALVSVGCSLQEKEHAKMWERSHKKQLAAAIDVLGCTLPNNLYALNESKRLRSALSYVGGTD